MSISFNPGITNPQLASGSFFRGPEEDAVAVDIYNLGSKGKEAINSVRAIGLKSISQLEGFFNSSSDLSDFIEKGKDKIGLEFNADVLTARLLGASSEFKASFSELSKDIKSGASLNLLKSKARELQCTVNDLKCAVNATNIKDVKALGGFLNSYTGTKIFSSKDTGAVSGILASVVDKCEELGIRGAYGSLMETVQDSAILSGLTKSLLPIAIAKNYPTLLRDISVSPYGKMVNVLMPGAVSKLVKDFSIQTSSTRGNIDNFEDLFITLDSIQENWGIGQRGDNSVFDVSSLVGGSAPLKRLLLTGVQHFVSWQSDSSASSKITTPNGANVYGLYGIAAFYNQTTAAASIKKHFPRVALVGTYDMTVPRTSVDLSRTNVRSAQSYITDARLLNHAISSLF